MTVRAEHADDRAAVFRVNREAFGRDDEARLVDALRASPAFVPGLSLVAVEGTGVVGHVLFTRVTIRDADDARPALALAPLAVLPVRQGRGIGTALVRRGLADARADGHRLVVVLGHPRYYPRFGFVPAEPLGLRAPFPASPGAFQVLALAEETLAGVRGAVEYAPAFAAF